MRNTYQIKISYQNNLSLHKITSLIESVKGVKIKQLNLIIKGRDFVGVLGVEVSHLIDLDSVVSLIQSNREVSTVEKIYPNPFAVSTEMWCTP